MKLTPELAQDLLAYGRACGRPNRQNHPCGMQRRNRLPCMHHTTPEDLELEAFIETVLKIASDRFKESQATSRENQIARMRDREEEILRTETRKGMRRYTPDVIHELATRQHPRPCGRPTTTTDEGRPCTLLCESFAPACKWHLEDWEWNIHRVAEEAVWAEMQHAKQQLSN